MARTAGSVAALLFGTLIAVASASGQTPSPYDSSRLIGYSRLDGSVDEGVLAAVYRLGTPASQIMVAADRSAWPLFIGTVPSLWLVAATSGGDSRSRLALSASLAQGSAIAVTLVLKRVVNRPRPYTRLESIEARARSHRDGTAKDPYSFPSGHAAMSFAIATAVATQAERWFVTIPALIWASSVSISRIWLGVHYPSDVLVGALLGVGAAVLSHFVADALIDGSGANLTAVAGFPIANLRL